MSTPANENIKLTVAYDGTDYLGWQKTFTGPSIEESLEKALKKILQQEVRLQAASRTDAGVHARGQVVNFISERELPPLHKLHYSLNCVLPNDISVTAVETAPIDFHPTLHCKGKEYRYYLCYNQTQFPHQRKYSWHFPYAMNVALMKEAAKMIVGKRDFAAFCNTKKNESYEDTVREVAAIDIVEMPHENLELIIKGPNFLYKMVRNIVGTLAYVGCGKIAIADLPSILHSNDRTTAGVTAPAHGLFLNNVQF